SMFDVVTFCSVLFLLSDETKNNILNEVSRILKPSGKIIVLTPSTRKSFFSTMKDIWLFPFSKYNWTFFVWKTLTADRGNTWQKEKWLFQYSLSKQFAYSISNVFYDYATIEIITKS
ncbi:MAG: class I SAM-dependent methyltransferase, partial [Bacteroidales bacterium]